MLDLLRALVEYESPSRDKAALDALGGHLAGMFRDLGGHVEILPNPDGGDHLRIGFRNGSDSRSDPVVKPLLVLGHFDTVWPLGATASRPFRVEGDRAFGPGAYDMKASIVLVYHALAALGHVGLRPGRPIELLLTSDEEIGSPTSRAVIEDAASRCVYALVVEPALAGGGLKTARKGVGAFTLEVAGRSAHAGVEPEKGVSAIVELAHQILAIGRWNDAKAGTTINVGVIEGGTTPNVVPATASARIDVRAATMDEARRIESAIRGMKAVRPGAQISISGGFNRPPMERSAATAALFEKAREIGRCLGMELTEGSTGGGSDGNFTAAMGVPTLDGLGALGAGAHAENEHVLISSLPERAALLAMLMLSL